MQIVSSYLLSWNVTELVYSDRSRAGGATVVSGGIVYVFRNLLTYVEVSTMPDTAEDRNFLPLRDLLRVPGADSNENAESLFAGLF